MSQDIKDMVQIITVMLLAGFLLTWGIFALVEHHENKMMSNGYVWVEDVAGHWEHR